MVCLVERRARSITSASRGRLSLTGDAEGLAGIAMLLQKHARNTRVATCAPHTLICSHEGAMLAPANPKSFRLRREV